MTEYEPVDITCEEYTVEDLITNETTNLSVSTELMDLPIMRMTRGFQKLAEEARLVDVKLTPSGYMNDKIPQITKEEKPMSKDISWKIDEVMERSVDAISDVTRTVPMAKFEIGRSIQWPDVRSAGVMICELTLETEMFCPSPVWREAEPVFVAAESEVFTPVFTGGVRRRDGPPSRGGGSYIASFCSANGRERFSDRSVYGRWHERPV